MDWNKDIINNKVAGGGTSYKYPQQVIDLFKQYGTLPSVTESDLWLINNMSKFLIKQYEVFNQTNELKNQFDNEVKAIRDVNVNIKYLIDNFKTFQAKIQNAFRVPADQGNAEIIEKQITTTGK